MTTTAPRGLLLLALLALLGIIVLAVVGHAIPDVLALIATTTAGGAAGATIPTTRSAP